MQQRDTKDIKSLSAVCNEMNSEAGVRCEHCHNSMWISWGALRRAVWKLWRHI